MLSLAFAVAGGSIDRECLGYRGQTIRRIRERMGSAEEARSVGTIGAILLLVGVEVCRCFFIISFMSCFHLGLFLLVCVCV